MRERALGLAVGPELHDVCVAAIRRHLETARRDLAQGRGSRRQLEIRVKLWAAVLEEEGQKSE